MENQFIYGYRKIYRLLKKTHGQVVNRKKVYRVMKENGWLCRVRPKKVPNLGKPFYVTENKLDRDFKAEKPLEKLVTATRALFTPQKHIIRRVQKKGSIIFVVGNPPTDIIELFDYTKSPT